MRVINEGVLNALQSTQAPTAAAQGQTPSADIFANAIRVDWNMEPSTPDEALELLDAMDAEYAKTMGKPAPDDEMAQSMRRVRHMACDLWAWQKDEIRAAFVALQQAQGQDAAPAEQMQEFWLWKNFVDGRPEYWAFDNPYPINLTDGDPQTLGEPCGYAIFKPSRNGRPDVPRAQVIAAIKRAKE
jgi:hypothetical protein